MAWNFDSVKEAAAGRWPEIIPALTPLSADVLTKGKQDHPCPVCGGKTVIWPPADAEQTGRLACRNCTNNKPTGDGIATVATFAGLGQGDAAKAVATVIGMEDGQFTSTAQVDVIEAVCRDKHMPVDAFRQFEPEITRGRQGSKVARVPVYDACGEKHSYFDFAPGQKGWFARGKGMSGMFFPGRLPAADETWCLVEGCKDAAALIGLGHNAAGMPGSYLAAKNAELFRGAHIVVVHDLDEAGVTGAQQTGGNLAGIAASVRVARLPGELRSSGGDDVRDVLRRDGGEQLVRQAIESAQQWQPRDGEHDPGEGPPEVHCTLNYGYVADAVTKHLGSLGWNTPWIPEHKRERIKLYHRGGSLAHVVVEKTEQQVSGVVLPRGTARIRPLPAGQLPIRIADACRLYIQKKHDGEIVKEYIPPPRWLQDGIYTRGDFGSDVRRLEGIITAPTLRSDGTILQQTGYDERTGLLHHPSADFQRVPDKPSQDDARRAADELLEVVRDFPFVSAADRSAWLSMVLAMVGRPAICGCVPLVAITATCRGSGKSLLCDAASLIAYGRPAARKPYAADDEEMRKAITATAIEALPAVLLDNVEKPLGGSSLDAALTAMTWTDRVLGASKTTGELPMRVVWAATGNNLRFGSDIARRVLPIRLEPAVENPEERTDFEHSDLLGWVTGNRARLAIAALTVLRAYFVADRPKQNGGAWGSYEQFSDIVRGALVWCGLADPLETRETAKEQDDSGAVVAGLIGGLIEIDDTGEGVTAKQIADQLNSGSDGYPTMREVCGEIATRNGKVESRKLGYQLRKFNRRVAKGWRVIGSPGHGGIMRWSAERVSGGDGEKYPNHRKPNENQGESGDGGDGGDANPDLYAGEGVCVPHTCKDTHVCVWECGRRIPTIPTIPTMPEVLHRNGAGGDCCRWLPELGLSPLWSRRADAGGCSVSLPAKLAPESVTAICDTREQTPLDLKPLTVVRQTLDTGDYALAGCDYIRIERKSLPDLIACVGRERDRFDREVERLLAFPVRILIVEATWPMIEAGEWRGKITPEHAIGALLGWQARGLSVHMCHDHERAGRHVSRLLYTVARRRYRELRTSFHGVEL